LLQKKVTAVGYETVQEENGALPILRPMSEVAGRVAALMGAYYQANPQGGRGVLFGGVSGVLPAHVVVLGGGTVGENAARVASGMGSRVTILESRDARLAQLKEIFPQASVLAATPEAIASAVASADILVGGVHVPGSKTPRLVTRALVRKMKPRSIIVDVAIDQGGSCETSRPTTHAQPTFVAEKVLHYCVTNMPGAYGRTSTDALTNATLPFLQQLAQPALEQLPFTSPALARGVQCYAGRLLCKPVADIQRRPFISFEEALRHP
jgi:alanine dehydrogenase